LILLLGTLFVITITPAQKWQNIIGYPIRWDWADNLTEHYDYGYLISGNISSNGTDDMHGWLVKTDINGEVLWDKQISVPPVNILIRKTLHDSLGNIYIFGWLHQTLEHEFPFILKLNACGENQWCRLLAIEGYNYGSFKDALILENGDLLGLAYMPEDDFTTNNRILLFRVSSEGDFIWHKGYALHENHPYFADPNGHTINKFGNLYIISGNVYSPYPNGNPNHVWQRPMFIGIDMDFEEKWVVEFGISDSLLGKAYGTIQLNDSILMGVGSNRYIENGEVTSNSFLMFYNRDGIETGHKIIDGSDIAPGLHQNFIFDIERIDQTNFLCAAVIGEEYQGAPFGEMVIDTAGNVYNYAIRENATGGGTYLVKTFDGKYTIACSHKTPNTNYDIMLYKVNENLEQDTIYPGNYTYDSLCPHAIQSGVIDLAGCNVITSIGEIPTLEEYRQRMQSIGITASPNPSNTGEVLLEFENTESFNNMELKVYDVYGKQIYSETVWPHQGAARLEVSAWPVGMYVATIFSNGQVKGKCKVVVCR